MENYGFLSFTGTTRAGPFHELILRGSKRQTIRVFRVDGRDHVKVGLTTKLYWRSRVKLEKKLGEPHFLGFAPVTDYETVFLYEMWHDEENAIADGFKTLDEFRTWFFRVWSWHTGFMKREYGGFGRLVPDHDRLVVHFKEFDHVFRYKLIKWEYPLIQQVLATTVRKKDE